MIVWVLPSWQRKALMYIFRKWRRGEVLLRTLKPLGPLWWARVNGAEQRTSWTSPLEICSPVSRLRSKKPPHVFSCPSIFWDVDEAGCLNGRDWSEFTLKSSWYFPFPRHVVSTFAYRMALRIYVRSPLRLCTTQAQWPLSYNQIRS
jgi:hypothetical protein